MSTPAITTDHKKDLLPSVKTLISFEEAMAKYYEIIASRQKSHFEFWKSVSLAKKTRASLYVNLHEDIVNNPETYEMNRGVTGPTLSLLNKINGEMQRVTSGKTGLANHLEFIRGVECAILEQSAPPAITGKTTVFRKIQAILDKIQSNQLRLIDGYLKYRPAPGAA